MIVLIAGPQWRFALTFMFVLPARRLSMPVQRVRRMSLQTRAKHDHRRNAEPAGQKRGQARCPEFAEPSPHLLPDALRSITDRENSTSLIISRQNLRNTP
jgi:hypothetical protein